MHLVELPDRRKSRQVDPAVDPFTQDGFVRCTDDLTVWHLEPGQWTRTPTGDVLMRNAAGERLTIVTGANQ